MRNPDTGKETGGVDAPRSSVTCAACARLLAAMRTLAPTEYASLGCVKRMMAAPVPIENRVEVAA